MNIKTLLFAINNEDPNIIISNLDKKIIEQNHFHLRRKYFKDNSPIDVQISDARTFSNVKIIVYGWISTKREIKKIQLLNGINVISSYIFFDQEQLTNQGKVEKKFFFEESLSQINKDKYSFLLRFIDENDDYCDLPIKTYESYDYSSLTWNTQYKIYRQKNLLKIKHVKQIKTELQESIAYKPLISIVVPVYNTNPSYLNACIQSIKDQIYTKWELILYDDGSTSDDTTKTLQSHENNTDKLKVIWGGENLKISKATNAAIKHTTGEYVGFLDHDDTLSRDALFHYVRYINMHESVALLYSDEDLIDDHGIAVSPMLKPEFSLDLLRCTNYINHFCLVKKSIGDSLGWLQEDFEGAQDYDLLLRIVDIVSSNKIKHIPKVLYHWRKNQGSITDNPSQKKYVFANGKKALEAHLSRNKIDAQVDKGQKLGTYYIKYHSNKQPLITIIIPFRDKISLLKKCLTSIRAKTLYKNYEIILVDNRSVEYETRTFLKSLENSPHIRVLLFDKEFNYSAINNYAVRQAKGEYILLLNNDIEIITKGWLQHLYNFGHQDRIGAVGAILLYPDHTIQHEGVTFGYTKNKTSFAYATHINKHYEMYTSERYLPHVIKNVSGVTAACLFVKKEVYNRVGGMDDKNLKIAFNDVDFCFKISELNLSIILNPYVQAIHYESISRGYNVTSSQKRREKKEFDYLYNKWVHKFETGDPYLNEIIHIANDKMNMI